MSRVIVYGNGKSRLKWDLKQDLHDDIITWGCNRIYNDIVVDNLVAVDFHISHMVYESGYANNNKCWFASWNILPREFDINHLVEQFDGQGCKIIENDKTNKIGKVVNGYFNPPITNKDGLYITWVNEDDMVEDIDFPKEWSSGTTAIHLACQQGAKEIYLMGFDLSSYPINNVYEDIQRKYYSHDPHRVELNRPDWIGQMKTVMNEFRDTQFIWVEPDRNTVRFDMNNLTYDTYENIRRKICR